MDTDFYAEENRQADRRKIILSPSGRYSITVDSYTTVKGSWNYTRGRVFSATGDRLETIADVKRNYSTFPFLWLEGHGETGHDYLLCGSDYQGQTFVDLTTGQRRDTLSDGSDKGFGFCWAAYKLLSGGRILLVDGCYWACPYEYRFFNVSDPIEKGWPELKIPEEIGCLYASDEGHSVEIEDEVIVWKEGEKVFKATGERESEIERNRSPLYTAMFEAERHKRPEEEIAATKAALAAHQAQYPEEDEDAHLWRRVIDHIVRLRVNETPDGKQLQVVEEWKSDHRIEKDKQYEEYEEKRTAELRKWKETDPFLATLGSDGVDLSGLVGFMYPSQVMKMDGDQNPVYFRLSGQKYDPDVERNRSATIEWGAVDGQFKVELWVRGQGDVAKPTFPRTPKGIRQAWAAAQTHITAEVV
jgi:hypothetical protein